MSFSIKMKKANAKTAAKRRLNKYKLKTKKAFAKRFRVCGSLRNKMFKYHAIGYRHLNRNKTSRNLKAKRGLFLTNKADQKRAKKMMPYFRRRKSLR